MKVNVIKVAMIMVLGFVVSNQIQAQHVESTVRAYRISADTDSSGGEGIQFYVRNQQLAYFIPGQNVFLTKTYFDGETILQNTTAFNGVANFNAGVNFNRNVRATRIGFGVTPETAIHVRNQNIRVDGGEFQSYGPIVLHPDTDNTGDDWVSFRNSVNQQTASLQDGVLTLRFGSRLQTGGGLTLQPGIDNPANDFIIFKNGSHQEMARIQDGILTLDQIRLNVTTFPDYVFANDYKLMPLEEVDEYIKKYKHLPNVPTETEVVKEGMNVGQINTLLVEKVEELTLYIIQLKKDLGQQRKEINNLIKNQSSKN